MLFDTGLIPSFSWKTEEHRVPSGARLLVTGLGCGLLAFLLTGTFHWAYLAALGSAFLLAVRASGQPTASSGATRRTDERASCDATIRPSAARADLPRRA